jgi:transcriptional regulator with XRE-family HTH domain
MKKTKTVQAEVARRAGISQSEISLLLSGKRSPSLATARAIAAATGGAVTIDSWPTERAA